MSRSTLAPLPFTLSLLAAAPAFGADAPATPAPAPTPKPETKDAPAAKPEAKPEVKPEAKSEAKAEKTELKDVTVQGTREQAAVSSPKYVKPLAETPQSATIVSQEVMQQQGASNLAQVLKNSPGISMQAGEGGAPNGDNLTIRGFAATSDLFINGVRDFGSYSRDPFNIEQVEVVKGPNSANAGRGSTGGSVNLVTKTPKKETFYAGSIAAGTDGFRRLSLDVNQSLDGEDGIEGAAFRINAVGHMDDAPGRDVVENRRMGIAPSLTFGLGSPTQLTLEFFHLEQENIPDYGLPFVPTSNANANPGSLGGSAERIAPVSYDNFYGLKARDYEKVATDVAAIVLAHEIADGVNLSNRLQYGRTTRDQVVTPPRFANATGTNIRRSDVKTRDQVNDIFTNQTNLLVKADLGGVKNTLSAGIEAAYETSNNKSRAEQPSSAPANNTDLWNPDPLQPYASRLAYDGGEVDLDATTLSAYLFDTVDFDEQWSWMGGARFDRLDTNYVNTTSAALGGVRTALGETFDLLSWRTALTFKPAENGAVYAAYGTSYNTSTDALSQTPFTNSGSNPLASQIAAARRTIQLDPEKNDTVEIGTKWNLAHQRLLLSAAVFRTDKTNARSADPTDPTNIQLVGEQRVQGVELGATGRITKEWSVIAGYCWLDSEVRKSANPAEVGAELGNTPKHTASLWTTYDFNFGLTLGAGASYVSDRFSTALAPSSGASIRREVDGYVTFDAMVNYKLNSHWNLQLNVYNLADERYIGTVGGGHAIPGAGRSGVLSASFLY